ncbi:Uma2 family endonuclease [Leptolyngbya sp. 7M]|uniref:Uma2 family endonuclease n=1 Tax=Leptolyngbya sp. 7M TaxID=2812896 RepID=UPI001B8B1370|nr:Uma2 family endonuclease [Leptolyngbya sp. 7M]QYO63132.1 Uma2 family endonuclease [Leptolyngbya sp. 7M]
MRGAQPDDPDCMEANASGQTRLSSDGYIEGALELTVEIAASSAAIDTGSKKQVYRRNGVLEYVIWQSYENQLEWFWLTDGEYQLLPADLMAHSPSDVSEPVAGGRGAVEQPDGAAGAGGGAGRVAVVGA